MKPFPVSHRSNTIAMTSTLSATCHCGAVHITIPAAPECVTNCNCSLCRRTGALWAYYTVGEVKVTGHPEHTCEYIWGDRMLKTIRCRHCGSVTHWEPLPSQHGARMGVNIRNFEPAQIGDVRIRRFDGADTWTYIDEN
ncbi:MAG: GFA family protein [Pseudomonadota bacterium]